jgi:Tol biopolymer transport system component
MGELTRAGIRRLAVAGLAAVPLALAALAFAAAPGTNTLVSRPGGFGPLTAPIANDSSVTGTAAGPADGSARTVSDAESHRYVAFVSDADGLSDADDDRVTNVYVRDRQTNTTILVSRADGPAGAGGNGGSSQPAISSDGRYVAFSSSATNLVPGISVSEQHVYLRDLQAGVTTLVDRADGLNGAIANAASSDPALTVAGGQPLVAFASGASNLDGAVPDFSRQVYVRAGADTAMVSRRDSSAGTNPNAPGNGLSGNPSISTDGAMVAFESSATNLVDSDTNAVTDVFRRVRASGATALVSRSLLFLGNDDSTDPSISGNGSQVAFTSTATNLASADTDTASDVYVRDMAGFGVALASRATGPDGAKANAPAVEPSLSDDASTVVFSSTASNLAAADTNGASDVFARTGLGTVTPATELVSRPAPGALADGGSFTPSIARAATGGTYLVAFTTLADNMGGDDENDFAQVYAGTVGSASSAAYLSRPTGSGAFRSGVNDSTLRPSGGGEETVVASSQDGRFTAFLSASDELVADDDDRFVNVFRRDNLTGETLLVSRAGAAAQNGTATGAPGISADGNRIAFASDATNLVPGDTNGVADVFVRDVAAGTTVRASVDAAGAQLPTASGDPAISGDGNRVAFVNDDEVQLRDLAAGTTVLVSRIDPNGAAGNGSSSAPALDADGDRVAFQSTSSNLVPGTTDANAAADVFLRDLAAGRTRLISANTGGAATGGAASFAPAIDATGNQVAFVTAATNLVAASDPNGAADVVLRDVGAGATSLVSANAGGGTGNSSSRRPSISADGTRIAFESLATDIVSPDVNGAGDVLVRDRATGLTERASHAPGTAGAQLDLSSGTPSISGDGNCVAFETSSRNAFAALPPGTDFTRVVGRALRGDCPFGPVAAPPPPGPSADTTPPVISNVRIRPSRFRAGRRARLRFTLSEPARVTMRVELLRPGVRVRGRCVRPRRVRRPRCTRRQAKGTVVFAGRPAGANAVTFRGRVRGRRLARGRYRASLQARDAAGNRSATRRVRFTILRPPRKQRPRR